MSDLPEPPSGTDDVAANGAACLSCGAVLTGPYCAMCGQRAEVHRTVRGFLHELAHGVLHIEGKFWRTLAMLVLRPGELTRRYIAGERSRFVSPIALFLFAVVLMFAVFQIAGAVGSEPADEAATVTETDGVIVVDPAGPGGKVTYERSGVEWIDERAVKVMQNPSLLFYKMQANAYKLSWLLIPLLTPLVWLLFAWHRRFGPYDHAVFVTYSLTFATLVYLTARIVAWLGLGGLWLTVAGVLVMLWHLHRQLRGAYRLSRLQALWRTVAIAPIAVFVLLVFAVILLLISTLS